MEEKKIFVPHELRTIEIDVEKKIFRVNGEDFASDCDEFVLRCSANRKGGLSEYLRVSLETKSRLHFANYDYYGNKTKEECHKKSFFQKVNTHLTELTTQKRRD